VLAHMTQASEGAGVAGVNITNRTVSNVRASGTCHSGIVLGLNGILSTIQGNGGSSAISGQWLNTGTASGFYVQHTIISGTLDSSSPTESVWNQLNANRIYDNEKASAGLKTTVVFFEISSDVSGSPVVDTATMTFVSEQGLL
jgi:hypothetical protein